MKFDASDKMFCSIREAARIVGVSHDRLRAWQKAGELPGFYSGSRYYVNFPRFLEKLEAGEIGARPQRSGEATEDGGSDGGRFCGGDNSKPNEGGRW